MKKKSAVLFSAETFYDEVSEFYGEMVDFEKNLSLRLNAYQKIFATKGAVADLGCGIGLDSIALAMNGHKVTAFDISPKMIEEVRQNALKFKVTIATSVHSFESVPKTYNGKFNYVVSVGNTIAHINSKQLQRAFKRIYDLLIPGGKIFLHILNYELIRSQQKRINNIAVRNGKVIIRFYDFLNNDLNFNILSFPTNSTKDFKLVTTRHYPYTKSKIHSYLKAAFFKKITFMKNFVGEKFEINDSKDLFVGAVKN